MFVFDGLILEDSGEFHVNLVLNFVLKLAKLTLKHIDRLLVDNLALQLHLLRVEYRGILLVQRGAVVAHSAHDLDELPELAHEQLVVQLLLGVLVFREAYHGELILRILHNILVTGTVADQVGWQTWLNLLELLDLVDEELYLIMAAATLLHQIDQLLKFLVDFASAPQEHVSVPDGVLLVEQIGEAIEGIKNV